MKQGGSVFRDPAHIGKRILPQAAARGIYPHIGIFCKFDRSFGTVGEYGSLEDAQIRDQFESRGRRVYDDGVSRPSAGRLQF